MINHGNNRTKNPNKNSQRQPRNNNTKNHKPTTHTRLPNHGKNQQNIQHTPQLWNNIQNPIQPRTRQPNHKHLGHHKKTTPQNLHHNTHRKNHTRNIPNHTKKPLHNPKQQHNIKQQSAKEAHTIRLWQIISISMKVKLDTFM